MTDTTAVERLLAALAEGRLLNTKGVLVYADDLEVLLSQLRQQGSPTDPVLVPVEPTEEMVKAGASVLTWGFPLPPDAVPDPDIIEDVRNILRAALSAAAPTSSSARGVGREEVADKLFEAWRIRNPALNIPSDGLFHRPGTTQALWLGIADAILALVTTPAGGEGERDGRIADLDRSEEDWDKLEDAIATVASFRAGRTLTEGDVEALSLVQQEHDADDEGATEAYHRGVADGRREGGGADTAALLEKLDAYRVELHAEKALRRFDALFGVRRGAAHCREVMARFVEEGGDATTANSIRHNWHLAWGEDPGAGVTLEPETPTSRAALYRVAAQVPDDAPGNINNPAVEVKR